MKIKTFNLFSYLRKHSLPLILIMGGITDQTTDLLVQFTAEVGLAPKWGTGIRIAIMAIGAYKLHLAEPPRKKV